MVSLKLIELLENGEYKVWHDFKKEKVTEEEFEEVVAKFFGRGKIIKTESLELYSCLFDDNGGELLDVWHEVWIWENCPHSFLDMYYEDLRFIEKSNVPLWELIERNSEFAYKGYKIDSPLDTDYVFEYLGFE